MDALTRECAIYLRGAAMSADATSKRRNAKPKLTPHNLRAISVTAGVDPRTVLRYLAGVAGTSTSDARIASALRAAGRDDLVRGVAA